MLIPDSLRQEDMPMMVYFVCKFISGGEYSEQQIIDNVTAAAKKGMEYYRLNTPSDSNPIQQVMSFAEYQNNFILKNKNGKLETTFSKEELKSFDDFSYATLKKIKIDKDNKFSKMLAWLLGEKQDLSKYTRATDFPVAMNIEGIDANIIHGFLFWIEMLGLVCFEGRRTGTVAYSLETVLARYLERHPELKKRGSIPMREFCEELVDEIPLLGLCIKGNNISFPLSQGFRVLEHMEKIKFDYMKDSGDVWHLSQSSVFKSGNNFSNVRVV